MVDGGNARRRASESSLPSFQANCARARSRENKSVSLSPADLDGSLIVVSSSMLVLMTATLESIPDVLLPLRKELLMNDAASPTARALLTLELVQSHPGITAERLGERLGVSERAARRYVGILREASIPIESVRGPYGGYRVGRGVRLPPLTFSSLEALGLVMATLDGHHRAGDPSDPVGSALGKILRALPE